MTLRARLRTLYEGKTNAGDRFRYALLAFDLLTVGYLIANSFLPRGPTILYIDVAIGLVFLADILARHYISRRPMRDFLSFWGLADVLVVVSLLFPIWGEGLAFLRVLRLYRVLNSPQTLEQLTEDFAGYARNQQTVGAAANLLIFIFAMTSLVYQTQSGSNQHITNYVDALYFTVTTLTTTGYGDLTLVGNWGRILSVIIMIFGISLFLRLVQVALRPSKAHFPCPVCGLTRHDHDAVHCKACGTILNIPDEGRD